jgi:tetratricopeptide (TPR) repeat protein
MLHVCWQDEDVFLNFEISPSVLPFPPSVSNKMISRRQIRSFPAELLCAGGVFVATLLLYSWTLAPTVTLTDSGELIVVAHGLGVAHPPGFPLWTILAHLASLVPLGNVAVRINFASALFAALASATLTLVVAELMIIASYLTAPKRKGKRAQRSKKTATNATREGRDNDSGVSRLLVLGPAIGAGLLLGFSRTLWSYATIAEVYTLNTLLICVIFFLMLRWRRCIIADRTRIGALLEDRRGTPANTIHDSFLYAAALAFGLALGVHHVSVALILPALAVIAFRTEGLKFFASRRLIYAALISFGALVAIYAYLPLAAAHMPVINWGTPRSLQEIWWHVTGRQYQVFLSFTPEIIGHQFLEFLRLVLREFGFWWLPVTLVLALAGFANAFKWDRTTFWFLLAVIIADLAYGLSYQIAEDKDAYYLPTFFATAIAAGFGIHLLIQFAFSKPVLIGRRYLIAVIAVLLPATLAVAANWPFNNRRHYFVADDYVENLLSTIGPEGLLLTFDWQVASPMLYAQEVEQRRRDVKVVDINLLRRSWYFDYLKHAYPGLIDRSREKIDLYVDMLKQWERDPGAFARSQALTQRISLAFSDLIHSIVTKEITVGPVYITKDLLSADQTNAYLIRWIPQTYQLIPQGLVFRLATDQSFHDSPEPHLQTRGLADGTLRFEKHDVVNLKVLPVYTSMLINRGRYLAAFNQHERAISLFRQALALDPELDAARQGIAESTGKLPSQ